MPQLIPQGPFLPPALMNALDDGNVVFFCGAGVSVGTGIPGFGGLVEAVWKSLGKPQDDLFIKELRDKAYDRALHRLDQKFPDDMRACLSAALTTRPKRNSLGLHEALIRLATDVHGATRLVTTNADDRFKKACRRTKLRIRFDDAPKLPIPKHQTWNSIVHLHGRVSRDCSPRDLVFTSADFGGAYLRDRWAARFVTELFRHFVVVFIGYSLNDPIMAYLMDALAAESREKTKTGGFQKPYAFVGLDGSNPHGRLAEERNWQAKGVDPILYDAQDKHRLLRDTLLEWAALKSDPIARLTCSPRTPPV